jgi:hypothetical protein
MIEYCGVDWLKSMAIGMKDCNIVTSGLKERNVFLVKQFREQAVSRHYYCGGAEMPRFTIEAVEGRDS